MGTGSRCLFWTSRNFETFFFFCHNMNFLPGLFLLLLFLLYFLTLLINILLFKTFCAFFKVLCCSGWNYFECLFVFHFCFFFFFGLNVVVCVVVVCSGHMILVLMSLWSKCWQFKCLLCFLLLFFNLKLERRYFSVTKTKKKGSKTIDPHGNIY